MPSPCTPAVPARALLTVLICLCGCTSPEPQALDEATLSLAVEARQGAADQLVSALELAGLQPLLVERPAQQALEDPRGATFWHAWAWASAPAMRAARRRVEAARARARSAGQPGPFQLMGEAQELGDLDSGTRLFGTFDLIGLLGLGPAEAARALADAATRRSLGELEQAVWATRFEVDRWRLQLAATRATRARLQALAAEVAADGLRIEILESHGRLGEGALGMARLARAELAARLARLAVEESRARQGLASSAGLAPDAPPLASHEAGLLDAVLQDDSGVATVEPTADELLRRLPALRTVLLDYAVAEARLRHEAARRWPGLRLGPHLLWSDTELLSGAMLGSGIPWPGALDGRIEAARVEREAARERVEDALLVARLALHEARVRQEQNRTRFEQGAEPAARASARQWSAARAAFSVEPAALAEWSRALTRRLATLEGLEQARGALALASLDLEEARGPGADVPRLVDLPEERG